MGTHYHHTRLPGLIFLLLLEETDMNTTFRTPFVTLKDLSIVISKVTSNAIVALSAFSCVMPFNLSAAELDEVVVTAELIEQSVLE